LTAGLPKRRERLSIAEFLEDIQVGASLDAAARGLELVVFLPPEPERLIIEVDRQILAGAVANLLQNALKFSRALGRVSLRAHSAADRIFIEIEDECGGLPPGKADVMFRPFEQLDAERTGLGLGLAISRRGVEANGGKLNVRDLPGTGCVFIVTLPRSAPQPL
jgi:signal transduction histidine kinase